METVFLSILLSTDIIPPSVSDLTSVTRAIKSNSGKLSPISTLFIVSRFWTRVARQHSGHGKAAAPSQLTPRGRFSPKAISSLAHPSATQPRTLPDLLWELGLGPRGSMRKTAVLLDLLQCAESRIWPCSKRGREKYTLDLFAFEVN